MFYTIRLQIFNPDYEYKICDKCCENVDMIYEFVEMFTQNINTINKYQKTKRNEHLRTQESEKTFIIEETSHRNIDDFSVDHFVAVTLQHDISACNETKSDRNINNEKRLVDFSILTENSIKNVAITEECDASDSDCDITTSYVQNGVKVDIIEDDESNECNSAINRKYQQFKCEFQENEDTLSINEKIVTDHQSNTAETDLVDLLKIEVESIGRNEDSLEFNIEQVKYNYTWLSKERAVC